MSWSRREILKSMALAAGAAALNGCELGGGGPPGPTVPTTCTTARDIEITANHGHAVQVSDADLTAAAEKAYDITGGADHAHVITLTAEQMATIRSGTSVTVTSTEGATALTPAHTHNVLVGCHGTIVTDPGGGGYYG